MIKTRLLRSQKGMTLIELMVTLAVIVIIIPTVAICLFSAMKQYAWTKSYADMCGVVSAVNSTVERELSLASSLAVEDGGGTIVFYQNSTTARRIYTAEVTLDNGETINVLYTKIGEEADAQRLAFDPTFYKDVSVTASFTILPNDGGVEVTLTYTGVSVHVSTFTVKPI